jgi:glycosyltransferase involved in cell wall biosynthesis
VNSKIRDVFVEVSNTLAVPYTTGLQRVTREVLARLSDPGVLPGARVVPIRWCTRHERYRRLTGSETERLARAPDPRTASRSRAAVLGERLPRPLQGPARALLHSPAGRWARRRLGAGPPEPPPARPDLELDGWPAGAVFLDLEAAWHNPRSRAELLPELLEAGVIPAVVVADVLPELHPEWFDNNAGALFRAYLRAHLRHSAVFVCISEATRADLEAVAPTVGVIRQLRTSVMPIGADFEVPPSPGEVPPELSGLRYLLCVSTLEPRKNQATLIDAFDRLQATAPDLALVLVGKVGWKTEELVRRIRRHPLLGRRLFWMNRVDDALLDTLYANAFVSVTPSFSEGFGAPVVEALSRGVPTISSNGGALPEAGGSFAEYFPPDDVDALARLIERHLFDQRWHEAQRRSLASYRPPTWDDSAAALATALADL